MSIECMTAVWKKSKAKGSELLVLLAIADYARDDGTNAYPGIRTLAEKSRLTTRAVQKIVRRLEELGELTTEEGEGKGGTNLYTINLPGLRPAEEASVGAEEPRPGGELCSGGEPPFRGGANGGSPNPLVNHQVATTTTPLQSPAGSLPVVSDTDPAPAAIPAPPNPDAVPDQPAPDSPPAPPATGSTPASEMSRAEIEAAISQVIIAANQAMTANDAIDQARLRPIPTTGAGRQAVWDWIAEGIPIPLIVETVRGAVRQYQPDGHRRQISSMGYFADRIREANELRLAREAGSNGQHDGRAQRHEHRGVPATQRGQASRVRETQGGRRVSKYDSVTIRSGV